MSTLIDCSAAPVTTPRLRDPFAGARLHATDAQPRLETRPTMPTAHAAWRPMTGSVQRGLDIAAEQDQDGRTASNGAAYVTATPKQHFSIRSGPPPSRP